MKKSIALLTCIALLAMQLIIAVPFGVYAAEGDATPVYSFDYTDSTNTELWAEGGVDQSTTGLLRSTQFSNEESMANVTGSHDETVKSYITFDSGLRFRSKSRIDNGYHFAQLAIELEVGATYELVTNARVSGTNNTFDIMIADQIRASAVTMSEDVTVYAANNYVSSNNFAEKSVVFTATESNVYLTLALQAVDGLMGRVKSIAINKIETASESSDTVNEVFDKYYHTFDFNENSLYGDAIDANNYNSSIFANESNKCNVTNNGTVSLYKPEGSDGALRIKAGSAGTYTSDYDIVLKSNTEYVMVAYARVMTGGTFNINIKQQFDEKIIEGSSIVVTDTKEGYHVSQFTTGNFENSTIELNYAATGSGSGVLFDLTIYPIETSPVNGTFETGNLNGWMQRSATQATISTSVMRGSYSMKMVKGSNVATYFLAKQGKNVAYMWIKTNSAEATTQTVDIYEMKTSVKNTFGSDSLVGTMSAQSSNAGYTLFKFDFEVEADTIVALNLNSTQKDYWIDQIYVLPETYASFATFNTDKDGYRDTFIMNKNGSDIIATAKNPAKIVDNTLYLDGKTLSSEVETVLNLKAGETYKLSYYVKVEQGGAYGSEDAKPEVMLVDLAESDSSNLYKSAHYAVQLNDGWEYTNVKITPTEDSVYRLVLRCNAGSSAYFDDVALFKIGDIDGDSLINAIDIVYVRKFLLGVAGKEIPTQVYDINDDGVSDIRDLVAIKKKQLN